MRRHVRCEKKEAPTFLLRSSSLCPIEIILLTKAGSRVLSPWPKLQQECYTTVSTQPNPQDASSEARATARVSSVTEPRAQANNGGVVTASAHFDRRQVRVEIRAENNIGAYQSRLIRSSALRQGGVQLSLQRRSFRTLESSRTVQLL